MITRGARGAFALALIMILALCLTNAAGAAAAATPAPTDDSGLTSEEQQLLDDTFGGDATPLRTTPSPRTTRIPATMTPSSPTPPIKNSS